jgi:hypothetical protein
MRGSHSVTHQANPHRGTSENGISHRRTRECPGLRSSSSASHPLQAEADRSICRRARPGPSEHSRRPA